MSREGRREGKVEEKGRLKSREGRRVRKVEE
jgi:hypothetical protein